MKIKMSRLVKIMVAAIGLSAITASFAQTPDVNGNDIVQLCKKVHSLPCEAYMAGLDNGITIGLQTDLYHTNLSYGAIIALLKEQIKQHPSDGEIASWIVLLGIMFDTKELRTRELCHHGRK